MTAEYRPEFSLKMAKYEPIIVSQPTVKFIVFMIYFILGFVLGVAATVLFVWWASNNFNPFR